MPVHLSHRKNEKTLPPALSLAEAAAVGPVAEPVRKPDGLCRQVEDRKSPPSQPSPHWRQVVRHGEGAGTQQEGVAKNSEVGPGMGSYS